jgi:hypothetical protein
VEADPCGAKCRTLNSLVTASDSGSFCPLWTLLVTLLSYNPASLVLKTDSLLTCMELHEAACRGIKEPQKGMIDTLFPQSPDHVGVGSPLCIFTDRHPLLLREGFFARIAKYISSVFVAPLALEIKLQYCACASRDVCELVSRCDLEVRFCLPRKLRTIAKP